VANDRAPSQRPLDRQGEALLDAAGTLLATEGPEALTVRRIAATAGCSTMGLYTRFGSKDGVVEHLFVDGFERLQRAMAAAPTTDDALHDLETLGHTYRQWALENATSYGVMFLRTVPDYMASPEAQAIAIATFEVLVAAVRRAQEQGHFPDADPADIAHVLWATSHGHVSLQLVGMSGAGGDPDRLFAISKHAIVVGLDSREARALPL